MMTDNNLFLLWQLSQNMVNLLAKSWIKSDEVKMTNYKKLLLLVLSVTICCSSGAVFSAEKMRVVYHVSEANKVAFVLGNMRNHIKGVGGADKLNMVLVVHGPAGKEFHTMPRIF